MEVNLNEENFKKEVLEAEEIVLVDFWATWCGPCQMIMPIIEEIAKEGKVKVGKVNVDENQKLAIEYGVMSIPTLMFFKNGNKVKEVVGYHTKNELEKIISEL